MLDESLTIAFDALESHLRRISDADVRQPLQIAVLLLGGHGPVEIRRILGISADDYREAFGRLQDAMAATRAGA